MKATTYVTNASDSCVVRHKIKPKELHVRLCDVLLTGEHACTNAVKIEKRQEDKGREG